MSIGYYPGDSDTNVCVFPEIRGIRASIKCLFNTIEFHHVKDLCLMPIGLLYSQQQYFQKYKYDVVLRTNLSYLGQR